MKTLKQLEEEIRQLAYELYEKSGRVHGHDMDHWLVAERMVMSKYFGEHREYRDKPVQEVPVEEKPRRRKSKSLSPGSGRKTRGQTRSEV